MDTGHLLLAMLQTGRGTAVEFLRRKQITVTALSACASQRACTGRPLHLRGRDLAPESRKALEFAVLGAHPARVNKAENEHLLCAMLEDTACTASVWLAGLGLEVPRAARECRQLSARKAPGERGFPGGFSRRVLRESMFTKRKKSVILI